MRDIKIESLLNETKGNLFEFLIAQKIAQSHGLEAKFLKNIGPEFLKKLIEYQKITQTHHPQLMQRLALFSDSVLTKVQRFFQNQIVEDVQVIGKIALGAHDDRLNEADIVVTTNHKSYLFSLKLNKANSLINTKSAGIKSFFKTYFAQFSTAEQDQVEFNYIVELLFEQFARDMHAFYNIEYHNLFSDWDDSFFPVLPGDLPKDAKLILHQLYSKLISKLFEYLNRYFKHSPEVFAQSLYALSGQSNPDIISVIVIHKHDHLALPVLHDLHIQTAKNWNASDIILQNPEAKSSYGEIEIKNQLKLQLRIKPMNKFIHPSYKINCAIGLY
jgi:hypothetical protein